MNLFWLGGFLQGLLLYSAVSLLIATYTRVKNRQLSYFAIATSVSIVIHSFLMLPTLSGDLWASILFFPAAILLPYFIWGLTSSLLLAETKLSRSLKLDFWINGTVLLLATFIDNFFRFVNPFGVELFVLSRFCLSFYFSVKILIASYLCAKSADLPRTVKRRRVVLTSITGSILLSISTVFFISDLSGRVPDPDALQRLSLAINAVTVFGFALYLSAMQIQSKRFFMPKSNGNNDSRTEINSLESKVKKYFEDERKYLNAEMSATLFAKDLGIKLSDARNIVQIHFGFRNFNDFLNSYRVLHASNLLNDISYKNVKISAIAFECGFSSLSPFNRAFLLRFGMTPSQYRVRLLAA